LGSSNDEDAADKESILAMNLSSNNYDPAPLPEELPKSVLNDIPNWYESSSANVTANMRIAELERQLKESQKENKLLKEKLKRITRIALEAKAMLKK
jgi:hypothetical protein